MSYKSRTQRIFSNLNLQTNLIRGNVNMMSASAQSETLDNNGFNSYESNVKDSMTECALEPANGVAGNLQATLNCNEIHISDNTPSSSTEREQNTLHFQKLGAVEKKLTGIFKFLFIFSSSK